MWAWSWQESEKLLSDSGCSGDQPSVYAAAILFLLEDWIKNKLRSPMLFIFSSYFVTGL